MIYLTFLIHLNIWYSNENDNIFALALISTFRSMNIQFFQFCTIYYVLYTGSVIYKNSHSVKRVSDLVFQELELTSDDIVAVQEEDLSLSLSVGSQSLGWEMQILYSWNVEVSQNSCLNFYCTSTRDFCTCLQFSYCAKPLSEYYI